MIQANFEKSFEGWRDEARRLLALGARPEQITWSDEVRDLLSFQDAPAAFVQAISSPKVPKEFIDLARLVSCVRDESRWSLLYRILFRLQHEDSNLLKISIDPDIERAERYAKNIRRDIHKMHAFVRFKHANFDGVDTYVAWHEPEHLILKEAAPFFARRFGDKPWSIFTPDLSAHWDLKELTYTEGIPQHKFEHNDDFDEIWKSYYSSIFNPARIKLKAMKAELPSKYWHSLPEAELIYPLIREAPQRIEKMAKNQNSQAELPQVNTWDELKSAAGACRACPIGHNATNLVFGEGPMNAEIMIIGEQPGDNEDLEGRAFIGPAGQVLDQSLKQVGLDRSQLYITNAVKHFKWKRTEKTRLHQKPSGQEMHACRPWLEAELAFVKPRIIVLLGATAATSLLGRLPKISEERGQVYTQFPIAEAVLISWHPSAILRAGDPKLAEERHAQLTSDLLLAAEFLRKKDK